jgi:hypothetical protein
MSTPTQTLHPEVSLRLEPLPLTTLPPEEIYIKPMNPQMRVTNPGPFAWFFGLFKKAPMKEFDSANAGDVGNKANKDPVDSEELGD